MFRIRREFLDDLSDSSAEATIVGLRRALMIFHGPADAIVSVDNARWDLRGRASSHELRVA